jgi:hopanoid biosynthesis associated protein HpnK
MYFQRKWPGSRFALKRRQRRQMAVQLAAGGVVGSNPVWCLYFTMKQLILNADDFGLTQGVNQGIIRAHREGILTSTTLMATAPAFEDACALARANPGMGVGCHLVLVGGNSVSPAREISSLADGDGRLPDSLTVFAAKVSLGQIRRAEIERELRAQIEKIRGAGIEPSHVDTHKHTHAHPVVMDVLGRVAQDCGIKRVRKPVENLADSWAGAGLCKQMVAAITVRVLARRFLEISSAYGLRSPGHFLGLAMTGQLGPAALRRLIETLPEGTIEIMVHPGVCDAELVRSGSRLQRQRELELAGLLDADVKRTVVKEGIQLISYCGLN